MSKKTNNVPQTQKENNVPASSTSGMDSGHIEKPPVKFSRVATSWVFWIASILFIKFFICDIFVIPSGSMEPTLHGRETGGDRIFCTRVDYRFRNPRRWEVFVFKFPYEQDPGSPYKGENFIKRCVGLPGDMLVLNRGDVYKYDSKSGKSEIIRKSTEIQQHIWIPVYRQRLSGISYEELGHYWDISGGKLENGILQGESKLSFLPHTRLGKLGGVPDRYVRQQVVEFKCPDKGCDGKLLKTVNTPQITGRCPKCGKYLTEQDVRKYDYKCEYPISTYRIMQRVADIDSSSGFRSSNWHTVADLRLVAESRLESGQSVSMQLFDDIFMCRADFSQDESGTINVKCSIDGKKPTKVENVKFSAPAGSWQNLEFFRLDGLLYAGVGGELKQVGELPLDSHMPDSILISGADLNISQGAQLKNIEMYRDIHYFDVRPGRILEIPQNAYLALGDNCPSSNDSRSWGTVPQKNLVGVARYVWWPLHHMKAIQ